MIPFVLLGLISSDIPITTSYQDQTHPVVQYAHDAYYVFWYDMRHYSPERAIYCARVSTGGTVIDSQGVGVLVDRTVKVDAACDGTNFLAVIQDSC